MQLTSKQEYILYIYVQVIYSEFSIMKGYPFSLYHSITYQQKMSKCLANRISNEQCLIFILRLLQMLNAPMQPLYLPRLVNINLCYLTVSFCLCVIIS